MKQGAYEIRTLDGNVLLGYKALKRGRKCLAIYKGKLDACRGKQECLGTISAEELSEIVESGPYIDLDDDK